MLLDLCCRLCPIICDILAAPTATAIDRRSYFFLRHLPGTGSLSATVVPPDTAPIARYHSPFRHSLVDGFSRPLFTVYCCQQRVTTMTTIRYPVFCANFPERLKSHRARLAGSTLVVLVCINHRWEALPETRRARVNEACMYACINLCGNLLYYLR